MEKNWHFDRFSAKKWSFGESLRFSGSSGEDHFYSDHFTIGINLGPAHTFHYTDGSRESTYDGILNTHDIQITPAHIAHTASWKNADFGLLLIKQSKIDALLLESNLDAQQLSAPRLMMRTPFLASVLVEIKRAAAMEGNELYLEYLLAIFLYRAITSEPSFVEARGLSAKDPRWARLFDYIEANVCGPISLDDLARVVSLSKFHFVREYKRLFLETPAHTVRNIRLGKAESLLCGTDIPVYEIAYRCGFLSAAHFSRVFRARFGQIGRAHV